LKREGTRQIKTIKIIEEIAGTLARVVLVEDSLHGILERGFEEEIFQATSSYRCHSTSSTRSSYLGRLRSLARQPTDNHGVLLLLAQ
jgi:hypothetical protein